MQYDLTWLLLTLMSSDAGSDGEERVERSSLRPHNSLHWQRRTRAATATLKPALAPRAFIDFRIISQRRQGSDWMCVWRWDSRRNAFLAADRVLWVSSWINPRRFHAPQAYRDQQPPVCPCSSPRVACLSCERLHPASNCARSHP
jgi:hypothetical protein